MCKQGGCGAERAMSALPANPLDPKVREDEAARRLAPDISIVMGGIVVERSKERNGRSKFFIHIGMFPPSDDAPLALVAPASK